MGGRAQSVFLIPYMVGEKAFPYGKSFRKKSGETPLILSLTSHSDHMQPETLRALGLSTLAFIVVLVWGFVLWMACYVSTIILQTLQQIVDLAAISP